MKAPLALIYLFTAIIAVKIQFPCADAVKLLSGYECVQKNALGYGNYAIVYLVRNIESSETRILKVASLTAGGEINTRDSTFLTKFKGSKHIIQLYEEIETSDHKYLIEVLEYGDQGDLKSFVSSHPHYFDNYKNLLDFSQKLVEGLIDIHNNKVIHADLVPSNIVVKISEQPDQFEPKYIDFNQSVIEGVSTVTRGDPIYNAPEVLIKRGSAFDYTAITDVYSLGNVLYFLYFKRLPFGSPAYGYKVADFRKRVEKKTYFMQAGVPLSYMRILQGCLQWSPDNRYSTKQLLDAIETAQAEVRLNKVEKLDADKMATLDSFDMTEVKVVNADRGELAPLLGIMALVVLVVFIACWVIFGMMKKDPVIQQGDSSLIIAD